MTKLTEWFPANVKPVHVGVYETKSPVLGDDPGWYCFWNGVDFCRAYPTPRHAVERGFGTTSQYQNREWRGLAEEP